MSEVNIPNVLTIAGSDSSGGAGIQADLKTFQARGCYGMSAVTVLTAQNTLGVNSVFPVSPSFVEDQLAAVLEDIRVDAVKVGMLYSTPLTEIVAKCLRTYKPKVIVVDPVMVAKGGFRLLEFDAVIALKEYIIPLATVLTPNIDEAELLLECSIQSKNQMEIAARNLLEMGPKAVVVKGGHLKDQSISPDFLVMKESEQWLEFPRVSTNNTHGTGCTYSAAIAAELAKGNDLYKAVNDARFYVQGAIHSATSMRIGNGHGPVDHAWQLRYTNETGGI